LLRLHTALFADLAETINYVFVDFKFRILMEVSVTSIKGGELGKGSMGLPCFIPEETKNNRRKITDVT